MMSLLFTANPSKRTLIPATTPTSYRPACTSSGTCRGSFGACIALAGARDGLVDDFGGRLGLPVRVELRVVA